MFKILKAVIPVYKIISFENRD